MYVDLYAGETSCAPNSLGAFEIGGSRTNASYSWRSKKGDIRSALLRGSAQQAPSSLASGASGEVDRSVVVAKSEDACAMELADRSEVDVAGRVGASTGEGNSWYGARDGSSDAMRHDDVRLSVGAQRECEKCGQQVTERDWTLNPQLTTLTPKCDAI